MRIRYILASQFQIHFCVSYVRKCQISFSNYYYFKAYPSEYSRHAKDLKVILTLNFSCYHSHRHYHFDYLLFSRDKEYILWHFKLESICYYENFCYWCETLQTRAYFEFGSLEKSFNQLMSLKKYWIP